MTQCKNSISFQVLKDRSWLDNDSNIYLSIPLPACLPTYHLFTYQSIYLPYYVIKIVQVTTDKKMQCNTI